VSADRRRILLVRWLAIPAGLVLTALEVQASPSAERTVLAFDVAVGWSYLAAGVLGLGVQIARRFGVLAFATSIAWFVGALSPAAGSLYIGPLSQLLITYPTGHVQRRSQMVVLSLSYLIAVAAPWVPLAGAETLALTAVTGVVLLTAQATHGPIRRARTSAVVGALFIATTSAALAAGVGSAVIDIASARIAGASALVAVAIGLAADLRWGGWSQDALARLVIDLGDRAEPATLQDRLAEAIDDPTLAIGYRLDDLTYVDDAGRPIDLPGPNSTRVAVPLNASGSQVGILVRDDRWPADPVLTDGVAAAAELAVGNARLQAATRRQLIALEASRARLIAAAEAERARIRRQLDAGALQRLESVRRGLEATGELGPEGSPLVLRAQALIRELEDLAEGLGPTSALEHGLEPAIRSLVGQMQIAVEVDVRIGPLPPLIEATAYFVCSEGLANVSKHAQASRAWLTARESAGWLRVEVADDGTGGPSPSPGSGLDGIRERVDSTGGRLTIEDRLGGGTRLVADLPLDRQVAHPRRVSGPDETASVRSGSSGIHRRGR
jgi:signal transduction histidine kinase